MRLSKLLLLIFTSLIITGAVIVFISWYMTTHVAYIYEKTFSIPMASLTTIVNVPVSQGNKLVILGYTNTTGTLLIYPQASTYHVNGTFNFTYYTQGQGNLTLDIEAPSGTGVHGYLRVIEYDTGVASIGYPIGITLLILSFVFLGYSVAYKRIESKNTKIRKALKSSSEKRNVRRTKLSIMINLIKT